MRRTRICKVHGTHHQTASRGSKSQTRIQTLATSQLELHSPKVLEDTKTVRNSLRGGRKNTDTNKYSQF
jgi:hypothetical protein